MRAWFPKDKGEGVIFNLWGQRGKAKCQRENPWNSKLHVLSHSPNQLILLEIGWSSYCMGMGGVWAGNLNLGKTHFWGKSILTFGASKHPKMHAIGIYIHVLHFYLMHGSLGDVSPPWVFLWYVSPSRFGLLGIFLIIIHPHWSSLKRLGIC